MTGTVGVSLSRDSVPLNTKSTGQDTCCLGGVPVSRCPADGVGIYTRSHCIACCLLDSQDWRARNHDALLARRRAAYLTREGVHAATSRLLTAPSLFTRTDDSGRFLSTTATEITPNLNLAPPDAP